MFADSKWSFDEFARLRSLDRRLFVSAFLHLGFRAKSGDRDALQSMIDALPISESIDWTDKVKVSWKSKDEGHDENEGVTLADACGMAILGQMGEIQPAIHQEMMRHFGSKDGVMEFVQPPYLDKVNPLSKLCAYAMRAPKTEEEILSFIQPLACNLDSNSRSVVFLDLPEYMIKLSSVAAMNKLMGITLYAHAVLGQNSAAVAALGRALKDPIAGMMGDVVGSQDESVKMGHSSLEIAAGGKSAAVVESLLRQARSFCDEQKFHQLVGMTLVSHVNTSGLTNFHFHQNEEKTIVWHEEVMPVFDSILRFGGQEFLDGHAARVELASNLYGQELGEEDRIKSLEARNLVIQAELAASMAIRFAHPKAIFHCQEIIESRHFHGEGSRVAESFDNPLEKMGLASRTKLTKSMLEDIFDAFHPDKMKRHLHLSGPSLLHDAAKKNNMNLAVFLVDKGVDPMAKDDRGWKAESHFKGGEEKAQWRAYLSSKKAMAAVDAMLNQSILSQKH